MPARLCHLLFAVSFALPAAENPPLQPFAMDHRHGAGAAVDLSSLLQAPAGKDGFVRVAAAHLVTPDGRRLRLWGVNITDWTKGSTMLPSKEDAGMWAATLARFGVNCVRLHFLDLAAPRGIIDASRDDTRSFDAAQLDRLDYWIAELKKHGIYIDLNLNVGRSYKPGDGVQDADKIRWGKGLTFYDARLIELQKEYARNLLTHANPYTKTEYRNEPAIAIVEICNENALYVGFRAPTPAYDQELSEVFNAWLKQKRTPEQVTHLRELAGVTADQPVPRLAGRDAGTAPQERLETEIQFFNEMESGFLTGMKNYLADTLHVKAPIIGTADHSHSGSSYSLLRAASLMDIVDGHTYWQHPGPGAHDTPMVNEPLKSTVVELSRTAFAGKPYTVSEVNQPFPSDYAAEGIPILAAYAALQDWDGIFWYTFEPKTATDWKPYIGDPFDISLDPVKMTQLAAGALMFARADIAPARQTVARSYTRQQVNESLRLPRTEAPYFTPGFPLALPLVHGSRIATLDGAPTAKIGLDVAGPIASDTGELTWYTSPEKGGLVTVDTGRTQAEIGFLKAWAKGLQHMAPAIENSFASLILSSLDAEPIARSGRLLLTAGASAGNAGATWNDTRTALKEYGSSPTVIEPVKGKLELLNISGARRVTISGLDGSGHRIGQPVAATRTSRGWQLSLGDTVTTWYEISVER
jgi:hypothetical protein